MNHERSSDEIRRDIERTRAEMDETVDALENRLSPGQLVDQAWSMFRRSGSGAGDVVREHPVPLALMGLGVAWLAIERATGGDADAERRYHGAGTYERAEGRVGPYRGDAVTSDEGWPHDTDSPGMVAHARDVVSDARDGIAEKASGIRDSIAGKVGGAGEAVSDARDRAEEGLGTAARRTTEMAGRAKQQARERAREARYGIMSFMDDQPLVAGAVAFGLGLASGLAVPSTPLEDRVIGDTSDAVKETVGETAREIGDQVRHVASSAAEAAFSEADRQDVGGTLKESVRRVAEEAKSAARETARQEDLTAEGMKDRARDATREVRDRGRESTP
jgi:hypothetical protein